MATFMLLRRSNYNKRQTQTQTGAFVVNLHTLARSIISTSSDMSKLGSKLKQMQTRSQNLKENLMSMIQKRRILIMVALLLMSHSVIEAKIGVVSYLSQVSKLKLIHLILMTVRRENAL